MKTRAGWCWLYIFALFVIPLSIYVAVMIETPVVTQLDPHNPPTLSKKADAEVSEVQEETHAPAEDFGVANASMGSGDMFDKIALSYDVTNGILSCGLHTFWRQRMMKDCMQLESNDRVLDLATGTADVSRLAGAALQELDNDVPADSVLGVDPSTQMLRVGLAKIQQAELGQIVRLVKGDAQDLNKVRNITWESIEDPTAGVATGSIDKISMAFGIRNVPDRALALREMRRVIRNEPRSRICILEFALPSGTTPLSQLARAFIKHLVPFMGKVATGGAGSTEYKYLERSILKFPQPLDFAAEMAQEGLGVQTITSFAYGGVHLYTAMPIGS